MPIPHKQTIDEAIKNVHWAWGIVLALIAGWGWIVKAIKKLIAPLRMAAAEKRQFYAAVEKLIPMVEGIRTEIFSNKKMMLLIADQGAIASFQADRQGRCTWVNKAWSDLAGQSMAEAMNFGWTMAIVGRDKERIYKEWISCCEGDRPFRATYSYLVRGIEVSIEAETTIIKDAAEVTVGFFGTVRRVDLPKSNQATP